jgi:hypothetical protein
MVGVQVWAGDDELARSLGVHTCHTPDCMNLVPVLLILLSTLYN